MSKETNLYKAFLSLKTAKEIENFLKDLCTDKELNDFADRLEIAQMLNGSDLTYRDISQKTGASLTTVTRVAKFLKSNTFNGYKTVIKRLKK